MSFSFSKYSPVCGVVVTSDGWLDGADKGDLSCLRNNRYLVALKYFEIGPKSRNQQKNSITHTQTLVESNKIVSKYRKFPLKENRGK